MGNLTSADFYRAYTLLIAASVTMATNLEYGFHSIDLKLWQHDQETLSTKIKQLRLIKQNKCEPEILHDPIDLWIAHITKENPRSRQDALQMIESLVQKNPLHLNGLADLQYLYHDLGRENAAEEIKEKIEKALLTEDKNDIIALAIFEQVYVVLFSEPWNTHGKAAKALKSAGDIIRNEMGHVLLPKTQNELKSALCHISLATQSASQVMFDSGIPLNDKCKRQYEDCIDKLNKAKDLLKGNESDLMSNLILYFEAFSHRRLYFLFNDSKRRKSSMLELMSSLKNSLICFGEFIERNQTSTDGFIRLYTGRAMAHVVSLITNHTPFPSDIFEKLPKCIQRITLDEIKACCEAERLLTQDDSTSQLDVIGAALLASAMIEIAKHSGPKDEKIRYALEAKRYIDTARHSNDECVWITFATGRKVNRLLAENTHDQAQRLNYLQSAYEDGLQCTYTKRTARDLSELAQICYDMSSLVDNPRYLLREVNGYLNESIMQGSQNNYFTAFHMGLSLFGLGEIRNAIEWMKKALRLSDPSKAKNRKNGFFFPYYYLMVYYRQHTEEKHILSEFKFLIQEGMELYGSVYKELQYIFKELKYEEECYDFCGFLIDHPYTKMKHQQEISEKCVQCLSGKIPEEERRRLTEHAIQSFLLKSNKKEKCGEDIFEFSDLKLPAPEREGETKYKYDFFVSHSENDRDWVIGTLLHFLENGLHDTDVRLTGCFEDRDFTPNETIIKNTTEAIENSRTVILVLSPNFIQCRWRDYETDLALTEFLDHGRDGIIPIMLMECEVPNKLKPFSPYSVVDTSSQDESLTQLKLYIASLCTIDHKRGN